jgi:hypothetical protein
MWKNSHKKTRIAGFLVLDPTGLLLGEAPIDHSQCDQTNQTLATQCGHELDHATDYVDTEEWYSSSKQDLEYDASCDQLDA